MTITPAQIRGARGMLRMLQSELAEAAGLTPKAMNSIETESAKPRPATLERIRSVLEARGVVFFDSHEGRGVLLKSNDA